MDVLSQYPTMLVVPSFTLTNANVRADVKAGTVMGVKRAAVRKLKHELGIEPGQVPLEKFKFLTRLHYWAADVVTHGPASPWGEVLVEQKKNKKMSAAE